MGPRLWCPGSDYLEHNEIVKTRRYQKEVQSLITDYQLELEFQREHLSAKTRNAMTALLHCREAEYELLQGKVDRLRAFFAEKLLHDVKGIDGDLS